MESRKTPYKIKFTGEAFDKANEYRDLSDTVVSYDAGIGKMNDEVEVLDRYDDFFALKIALDEYETSADAEYGITRNSKIHGRHSVVLPCQRDAALSFLKELRGFGLLADVVGSGKTIEACTVLSELAVRGNIDSMLLIVPDQVYDSWIKTLEMWFGLGKGVLHRVGAKFDIDELTVMGNDGFLRPKYPIIVLDSDFVKWGEDVASQVLFDVVVVDEAHHLCEEEGDMARAMKMLSLMMLTKRNAKKTYCLLLSATPHSGNLSHMFRLWYFIRCKGGNPSDFDEKEDRQRTAEYNKEKRYYNEHICRGATTVMEFIKKVKTEEVTGVYGDELKAYLVKQGIHDFDTYNDSEKWVVVDEFLKSNETIAADIDRRAASAYHNGVLRSIMIRQPADKKDGGRVNRSKNVVNYLLLPTQSVGDIKVRGVANDEITVHTDMLGTDAEVTCDDGTMSISSYIEHAQPKAKLRDKFENAADLVYNKILPAAKITDENFTKAGTLKYYNVQAAALPRDVETHYVFSDPNASELDRKLPKLFELLEKHKTGRVILFFDYDLPKKRRIVDGVEAAIMQDPKLASRLIVGTEDNRDKVIAKFMSDKCKNAVLLVKEAGFTEGANLQKCNIIINVQVTPDPLAMDQRIGRIFRLGQDNDVTIYSIADMRDLEGYVLMYFARIGLMTSNSGDATIIAGSNNARMVTIRCPVCGNVKLLSSDDYETAKQKDKDDLYCAETDECVEENKRGTLMEEISVYNFRCETCDRTLTRSVENEGYTCMSKSSYNEDGAGGILCNGGEHGDRELYCRKICALAHCSRFREGPLKNKCPALKLYFQNKNASDSDLMAECEMCTQKLCLDKCRLGTGKEAIEGCRDCEYATCTPAPHVIVFDDKWEALCPHCGSRTRSKIKPVMTRTFATFIRSAWDFKHDGGKAFCKNLEKEAENVEVIKRILDNDSEVN